MGENEQFAVWWASAGCLPDSDEPEFVGSLAECERYVADDPDGFRLSRIQVEYDLYSFSIEPLV